MAHYQASPLYQGQKHALRQKTKNKLQENGTGAVTRLFVQPFVEKMSNTVDKFFSFPDDVTTAPLITVCLHKLLGGDVEEHARLFDACKTLGFFYLDLSDSDEGEELISGSNELFDILQEFFQLPLQEKSKYDFASEGSYFGYKGMGAEVVDGAGTRDKNEIFNVSGMIHGLAIC